MKSRIERRENLGVVLDGCAEWCEETHIGNNAARRRL